MSYFRPTGDALIARRGYSGTGDVLDTLKSGGSKLLDLVTGHYEDKGKIAAYESQAQAQAAAAQAAAAAQGQTPSWLLPVGIGAAALVAVVVIKKRRRK